MHFSDWHIPITENALTLNEAHESLSKVGAQKKDIPLIVKLVENPAFSIPGITLFHGAVDLLPHDYIHILLGRGLLPADEAFTIGYTMGSTRQVSEIEAFLFEFITKHLYPTDYQFKDRDIHILRTALQIAKEAKLQPLDKVSFEPYKNTKIGEIRKRLGINTNILIECYKTEKNLYPDSKASKRLLNS